jgi:hypothetical protein
MDDGTDVNFGSLSRKLTGWLASQHDWAVATSHRVTESSEVNPKQTVGKFE